MQHSQVTHLLWLKHHYVLCAIVDVWIVLFLILRPNNRGSFLTLVNAPSEVGIIIVDGVELRILVHECAGLYVALPLLILLFCCCSPAIVLSEEGEGVHSPTAVLRALIWHRWTIDHQQQVHAAVPGGTPPPPKWGTYWFVSLSNSSPPLKSMTDASRLRL